ncbi:MAG: hypothetical protein DI528_06485 [Shinella sp.]|nr:MAG: hypothetical protein DI528_06485 [Shinella sp.]
MPFYQEILRALRPNRTRLLIAFSATTAMTPIMPGEALASCFFSGGIVSNRCDSTFIQGFASSGSSSLSVVDETTGGVEFAPVDTSATPTTQTLRITGNTTIYNPGYSAVYSQTFAAEHDLDVYIGEGVSITSAGGFGAVWLRNDVSGDISIVNNATVTANVVGPGITVTTNQGNVSVVNNGHVTSMTERGLYGDGGYNNSDASPVLVSITNNGVVDAYTAGIRTINYHGLSSITNTGTVTSTTRQGLVAWSASGGASLSNSGSVTAHDDIALQAWSTQGDVTIVNSGWAAAYDDSSITDSGIGHLAVQAFAEISGDISIVNSGTLYAPDDLAVSAEADLGDISIVNSGKITGQRGIDAVASGGHIAIENSGTVTALEGEGVTLRGARLTNSGSIDAVTYGVYLEGSGNSITSSGTISGDRASVFYGAGGNTLNILPGSAFHGMVDFNKTTGNSTTFGAGNYRVPSANYIASDNAITLDNASQVLILSDADTTGTINVVTATPIANIANQYTNSVSDVIGGILALDIQRPGDIAVAGPETEPLAYGEEKQATPAQQAIASISDGLAVDRAGNLFWARVFGGGRHQPGTSDDLESNIYHYGMIAGADRQFGDMRIGLFGGAGAVNAELSDNSSSIDGRTAFLGLYGSAPVNGYLVNGSFTLGAIDNETKRSINAGSEWAEGDFWGWYLSPEIAVSKAFDIAPEWSLTPSVRLRYVGAFYDSYTESGSSQNLSYDDRETHSLEGRLQMDLTRRTTLQSGQAAAFSLSGAVIDTQNLGDTGYMASLDDTEFKLTDSSARNVVGFRLGASFDAQIKEAMSVYGGVESTVYTDESVAYTGRLGLKTTF